jgi:hypothetical protein
MSRHIPRWAAMLAIAALAVVAGVVASLATSSSGGQPAARLGNHIEAVGTEREGGPNESIELIKHQDQLVAKAAAPFDRVAPGAYGAAVDKRNKAPKASLGTWSPIGSTPLHADAPDYAGTDPLLGAGVSQLGWHTLSGRITAWTYDPSTSGRIFAAPATGGVWESTDGGSSWRSVGDNLPTGAMGGVAFSKANGGTLIAGTGDSAVGGIFTPSGLGVYTSRNDGKTWTKATGVPDGLVVYRVAVDPNNANVNYVATSKGLYRSTDDGVSYTNVVVPTTCTDVNDVTCNFANTISDVAVQPGTGAVIAVAGWAYGQLKTKAGFTMAPQNGIYTSPNGAPGTFVFRDPGATAPTKNGFAPTPVVGRTSLSIAAGQGQDHDIVYALVQDATKLQGCYDPAIDIPICGSPQDPTLAQATYLDGMYVSRDFGKTWTKIMSPEQLRAPGTGSALQLGILGYGPGIQSWYNNWILADPGATDPVTHAPTRVLFGLEEIWENQIPAAPVTAPTTWKVIGRYWNACAQVVSGVDCAGGKSPIPGSTTHPDQHAAMIVPDAVGNGETLYVGNDGGAYKQHVFAGQDFTNENWGDGINTGLRTLQPYDAQAAKDGTVVMGLQDNGEAKISPNGRTDMIFGGDGFYTGIDPDNSNRIVEEYAGGAVSGTIDGGKTWQSYSPGLDGAQFATPLQLDPTNADHLLVAGRQIDETQYPYQGHCYPDPSIPWAACEFIDNWNTVYDLGAFCVTADAGVVALTCGDRSTTAADLRGDYAYAGWCGPCSVRGTGTFTNGVATNVAGDAPAQFNSEDGWHMAAAQGLPNRWITSIRIDPSDATGKTVYVTLGGYSSHWIPPGALGDQIANVGTGHVYVSHDAGETFTDVSGTLPDAPADWVLPFKGRLVVGTDVGVFVSSGLTGGTYSLLGNLPVMPVVHLAADPGNPNRIIAATYARGAYAFTWSG